MFFSLPFFVIGSLKLIHFSENCPLNERVAVQQGDSLRVGGGKPGALAHRRAQAFFRRVVQIDGSVPIIPLEWENFLVPYCKLRLFDVEKPTEVDHFPRETIGFPLHIYVSSTQGSFLRDPSARKGRKGRCWSNFEVGPRLGKLLAETAQVLNM